MTYEEAKEVLTKSQICIGRINGKILFAQAVRKAIEAIEKQIPKKPRKYARMNLLYFECPSCDMKIQADAKYCRYCGQKLDWSE